MAVELGISIRAVSSYESGERLPEPRQVMKYCAHALNQNCWDAARDFGVWLARSLEIDTETLKEVMTL